MMSESDPLILVTGASGFVASHTTKQLQEQGHRVRVTVRNAKNEKKVSPITKFCPEAKYPLEIVEADLLDADSWEKAVEGCTYVLHIASPFPLTNPKNPMEVIKPAVDGTLNVLKACAAAKTIKRVVLTSSVVAIGAQNVKESNSFSEDDYLKEDDVRENYYARSKILAEQAAWKYVKELPDGEKFELAVINPALVMGPVLHGALGTSMDILKQLLERKMPVLASMIFLMCDVRDVATAHIKCMTLPEAAGKRHIIATESLWVKEIALILDKEFKSQGYNIPTKVVPNAIATVAKQFYSPLKIGLREFSQQLYYDTTRMREVLHIIPTPLEKTLIDMAYSMIDLGFVKKTSKYRGHSTTTTAE